VPARQPRVLTRQRAPIQAHRPRSMEPRVLRPLPSQSQSPMTLISWSRNWKRECPERPSLKRARTYRFVEGLYQISEGTSAADPYATAHAVPDAPPDDSQPAHVAAAAPVIALDAAQPAPVRTEAPVRAEAPGRRIVAQAPAD